MKSTRKDGSMVIITLRRCLSEEVWDLTPGEGLGFDELDWSNNVSELPEATASQRQRRRRRRRRSGEVVAVPVGKRKMRTGRVFEGGNRVVEVKLALKVSNSVLQSCCYTILIINLVRLMRFPVHCCPSHQGKI